MLLNIKVIPQAKRNQIIQENDIFKVYLTAPAIDGKANKALVVFLAEHFEVKKRDILIKNGLKSRNKTVFIDNLQ